MRDAERSRPGEDAAGDDAATRPADLDAALAEPHAELERLSREHRDSRAEQLRLKLRIQELNAALRERHEAFLEMLDRLQEREEQEVKRALRELWRSEERFRLLVESVQEYAIFMLDPEGKIVSWNEGAARITGYSEEEVLGRSVALFDTGEEAAERHVERELRAAAERNRYEDEGWRIRKDGSRFWASTVITALRADDDSLLGFAQITRDLTERVQQQHSLEETAAELEATVEELRQQSEEAERARAAAEVANQAKSDFLAVMSHELRTPLNAIVGYTDLLEAEVVGPVNEKQKEHLGRIRRSSGHLLSLIEEILTYARVEAGRTEVQSEDLDLGELVTEVAGLVEPLAREKGLAFHLRVPDGPVVVATDGGKVRQILLNLLGNAVKFTDGGAIELGVEPARDRVQLYVRDTGIGIAEENLGRIFDPFWQVEQKRTRRAEGTGLGLSIARKLARLLGGDVSVESAPGEGTVFRLELPVGRAPVDSG